MALSQENKIVKYFIWRNFSSFVFLNAKQYVSCYDVVSTHTCRRHPHHTSIQGKSIVPVPRCMHTRQPHPPLTIRHRALRDANSRYTIGLPCALSRDNYQISKPSRLPNTQPAARTSHRPGDTTSAQWSSHHAVASPHRTCSRYTDGAARYMVHQLVVCDAIPRAYFIATAPVTISCAQRPCENVCSRQHSLHGQEEGVWPGLFAREKLWNFCGPAYTLAAYIYRRSRSPLCHIFAVP